MGVARRPAFVRFLGGGTYSLVDGDPALRRRFLDWTVFHVEPRAGHLFSTLRRTLAQRNAWLRAGGRGRNVWDEPYAEHLALLWQSRESLANTIDGHLKDFTERIVELDPIGFRWRGAMTDPVAVLNRLADALKEDVARGFTYLSPSRAGSVFELGGDPWVGSRGESKAVGMGLQVAAQRAVEEATGERTLMLLDDPQAELGRRLCGRVLRECLCWSDQVIATHLDSGSPDPSEPGTMFHVKQGALSPASPHP